MTTASGAGEYLLMKRGLYYRPGNSGYTGIKSEAGRYHEGEAYPDGGVTAIHQDDAPLFSSACWQDVKVKHLLGLIAERDRAIVSVNDAGRLLMQRLADHEVRMTSEHDSREWHGHVSPAIARFRGALTATPPQDKDA